MKYTIKYDLVNETLPNELLDSNQLLSLIKNFPWEEKYAIGDEEVEYPSIDIINDIDKKLLTITALDKKESLLFTVENFNVGKLARGTVGVIINDTPFDKVIEIVDLFCNQKYKQIKDLDNTGIISKILRKIIYLFATDEQ